MKNKAFKLALIIVIVGVLVFGVSFAKATTNEDMIKILQSLIQALQQMIVQLQTQLAQRNTTTPTILDTSSFGKSSKYCLDWDFFADNAYKDGQAHEEIKRIQEKLGVNPVGGHYGPKTQAAIEAFNKKYGIHQEIVCCNPAPDYAYIYQGTIAKFNELYCDKPLYTVRIVRRNNPAQCTGEEFDCRMTAHILQYNNTPVSIPSNGNPVIIKVPYSASVMIALNADFNPPGLTANANNLRCYISKVYSNNSLVAYYEPGERLYAEDVAKHSKTIDLTNFFFDFNPEGLHQFQIKNIKNDYDIEIDTGGCHSPRG